VAEEWKKRWGYETALKPSAPGIYRLKTGGYLIVVKARGMQQGSRKTRQRVMHGARLEEAKAERVEMRSEARAVARGRTRQRQLWSDYAVSLFQRKVDSGDLKSAKTVERWKGTLQHLIPAFGSFWCDELRYADIMEWRAKVAKCALAPKRIPHPDRDLAKAGRTLRNPDFYSPSTINGWLSILAIVCHQMTAELELQRDPSIGVARIDDSTHPTYTDESPNACTPDQARAFLAKMEELEPQHFPMVLLGLVTGLRPSSLRPLRRSGPEADLDLETGTLRVRRSNSKGQAVMNTTKTGKRQTFTLPQSVAEVLRAYVGQLDKGDTKVRGWKRQQASDLLFPAVTGKMRARSVLDQPFRRVAEAIGLPFLLTPRGLRRTFKDLARAADVSDVVAKAISGHQTDDMHLLYSTASKDEVSSALGAVSDLVTKRKK
jgi:integrase